MVIDKKNQIEQLTKDILKSNDSIHYVELKSIGLLYLNSLEGSQEDEKTGKYKTIGKISSKGKSKEVLKNELEKIIKKF